MIKNHDYFPDEIGVRQGEHFHPFLFSLFLNDLDDFFFGNRKY